MRVLFCGDRNWQDIEAIRRCVRRLPAGSVVIEGDARGADKMAGLAAQECGLDVEVYPAQWDEHGRRAGHIRNQQMLTEGRPDIVVYFHLDIEASKGTRDMVERSRKAGLPVYSGMLWSRNA